MSENDEELPEWAKPYLETNVPIASKRYTYATKQRPVTHKWITVSPNVASVLRELGFKVSGNSVLLEEDE